jgi:hypothetical protein
MKGAAMTSHAVTEDAFSRRWRAALLAATYERCLNEVDSTEISDPAHRRFTGWLASHWTYQCPPEPYWSPDAISLTRHGAHMMRWYVVDDAVIGYAPGAKGHYAVPTGDAPRVA